MPTTLSRVARLAVVVALTLGVSGCLDTNQQTAFDLVNDSRARVGLPALAESSEATTHAQAWADRLATRGRLRHSDLSRIAVAYRSAGENVGRGQDIESIHARYLDSPTHRDNIEGSWTHLGVGVAEADGVTYTVYVFLTLAG